MKQENISNLGEFGLIDYIKNKFIHLVPENFLGIGDDCAVLPINDEESYVISTDMLIENIHFLRDEIKLEDLVWKSLAVNLSDIAAMGGTPIAFLSSIALPKNIGEDKVKKAIDILADIADIYHIANLGGDTTSSKRDIAISISVIGKMKNEQIKYRHTANNGDILCVTGNLGDSSAGLDSILNNRKNQYLISKHHHPIARIEEGVFLSKFQQVNAMMDVSDGIASDLKRIANASDCGAEINIEQIPISRELQVYCKQNKLDTYSFSASGGEDYELLLSIDKDYFDIIKEKFEREFDKPLINIGTISEEKNIKFLLNKNTIELKGFNHF